eukprot:scaffold45359_cov49-Attheya_sp.AAC.1
MAGGHLTDPPASITYSSVVAGNAYLNAPCREKIWFTALERNSAAERHGEPTSLEICGNLDLNPATPIRTYRCERQQNWMDKKTGKAYAPPERYLGANIGM